MTEITKDYANAWGAVDNDEANSGGSSIERPNFLKLTVGDTVIRVLDFVPFSYKEYYIPKANGGSGASIGYFGAGKDLLEKANKAHMNKIFKQADAKKLKDKARKDFLRDEGYKKQPYGKVKEKHIVHVLNRATGEVELLDKGNGVFKGLKKYALHAKFGDLRDYDITITMEGDPADFQSIEYSVMPDPIKEPLTEAELALYEEKKIDLKAFKTPNYTPEQALMIANGATFQDVLGNNSDDAEEVEEKADEKMLPEDTKEETKKEEPAKEEKKEAPVDVKKGEALTDEELNSIDF